MITLQVTISDLCRGDNKRLATWLRAPDSPTIYYCIGLILLGCASYGFTVGLWRSPTLALYVAIKLPLLIFLVIAINGLLNGLLAQLLGSGLGFRQTLYTILMSFTTFAAIVGSVSPLILFLLYSLPSTDTVNEAQQHGLLLLTHTLFIAYAGIIANIQMLKLLVTAAGNRLAGLRTFCAWTLGNLFVGAQIAWILRPFFGSPGLPIVLLRPNPLDGNFYEALYKALLHAF